jgi:hypothetical protein
MTFNPILEKRNQQYSYQELKTFWQGPGRIVQRTKEQNPALYAELHAAGEAANLIGKSLSPNPQPYVKNYAPAPRQYSADELATRGQYSETEIRAFFADAKKANELFHSDRNEYESRREAGVSYGLFKARETPYVPVKPPEPEYLHPVSNELADASHIERGSRLPWNQVEQLITQKLSREREAQEAVAAKVESDRAAELEKLTAAQRADEAVRLQKIADLDRIQQLIAPQPTKTPEPLELATARAVAAEKQTAA